MNKKLIIGAGVTVFAGLLSFAYWAFIYTPAITTTQQMNGQQTAGGGFNNPGNLRVGNPVYNGEVDAQGNKFRWFEDMPHGLRAVIVLYRYYYTILRKKTLTDCINTYAPPSDGNATSVYVTDVATDTGYSPTDDIHDLLYTQAGAVSLMKAVTKAEQGSSFSLSDDDCNAAYNLLPIIS